jgi:outer membrane receptor for ferric coprogen and ferric-rhodotorulic acid
MVSQPTAPHRHAASMPARALKRQVCARAVQGTLLFVSLSVGAGIIMPETANAQAVAAASQQVRFTVPAGTLASALIAFAGNAGVSVSAPPALVGGLQSNGLNGTYSISAGLAVLLENTGLEAVPTGTNGWVVRKQQSDSADKSVLPTVTVTAGGPTGMTEGSGAYTAADVAVFKGSKIKDVPHAVSVVTRQQIEDQNLTTVTETLDKTTGITMARAGAVAGSSLGNDSGFYSRGFAVSNVQMDGGVALDASMNGFGSLSQIDMAQYDHIEFLRGIDGLFSSTGNPGGTVNLVRKRALATTQGSLAVAGGSWQNYRVEGDITGALTEDGKVRGRVGLVHQDRHYFYDIAQNTKTLVHGLLEIDVTPDTLLTVGGSYQKSKGPMGFAGLPRYSNGDDLQLPRSTANFTKDAITDEETTQAFVKLDHAFNEDWKVSVDAMYMNMTRDANSVYTVGAVDPVTKAGARWYGFPALTGMERYAANANVKGGFDAFGLRHQVIAGAEYQRGRGYTTMQWLNNYSGSPANMFDLNYPVDNGSIFLKGDYHITARSAFYGALQLALSERLKAYVGGRLSRYSYESDTDQRNPDGTPLIQNPVPEVRRLSTGYVWTPYAGVSYAVNDRWNVYASYAETYTPQYLQRTASGATLDPVTSKNYEIGVKGEVLDGRANTTLAVYRIEQTGAAVRDTNYPATYGTYQCCFLNKGDVVSQGIDAEISGEVAKGLQLMAGYTYNHNLDKAGDTGRYNSITPKHLLKVWGTYRLPAAMSKWKVGAGAMVQSAHYVSGNANTYNASTGEWNGPTIPFKFTQAGYAIWSMSVDYQATSQLSVTLNVNNLFDKTYYQTVGASNMGNFYGDPRNAMLTARYKF